MLAAITHHPLCKLVLKVLSKYETQSELMKKIFCGYFPGARKYKERVTEKSQQQRPGTRIKGHRVPGSNSPKCSLHIMGLTFLIT